MATCGIPECTRRRYERSGVVHHYCGRSHAQEAVSKGLLASLRPPAGICSLQGCSKPIFYERTTGQVHDFCCHSHARQMKPIGYWRPLNKGASMCSLTGCKRRVYRDPVTGKDSHYCGKTHVASGQARQCVRSGCSSTAWLANTKGKQFCSFRCATMELGQSAPRVATPCCRIPGCWSSTLYCRQTNQSLGYCSEEHRLAALQTTNNPQSAEPYMEDEFIMGSSPSNTFKLSALSELHPDFPSLRDQFITKWIKPVSAGALSVRRIYKVEMPAEVRRKHEIYTQTVHNVRRRFHGTPFSDGCNLFVDGKKGGPCGLPSCNICSICTNGFKLTKDFLGQTARSSGINLRYGDGLYFTSISGKANDYARLTAQRASDGTELRYMFVANVAAGKAYSTTKTDLKADMCPPQGYHSVVGEVGRGLNHDELVVYKEEAELPKYLIAYALR